MNRAVPLFVLAFASLCWSQSCPGYGGYSQQRHEPFSTGIYKLSYMRPAPQCRTAVSPDVEEAIERMRGRIKDPDLFRLFENSFPNTLDTTISWQGQAANNPDEELAFVVTGDIPAMWLRDSANQLHSYLSLLKNATTPTLASLFRGAINLQARYLLIQPYCQAFQPPSESGFPPGGGALDDVMPPYNPSEVWECKYELDSFAAYLQLSHDYYKATEDTDFFKKFQWAKAVEKVLYTAEQMMIGTYRDDGFVDKGPYLFRGGRGLPNYGAGEPVKFTGLVRSVFRPSDDPTLLQFLIPANMQFSAYLKSTAEIATLIGDPKLAERMFTMGVGIAHAIHEYGIVNDTHYGQLYAYEVDGFGGKTGMDDANLPNLLAAPLYGFVDKTDPVYMATRKKILSQDNPYYGTGPAISGIGSPHTGPGTVWPMSNIASILTSDNETEIYELLKQILRSTDGYGLIHESVNSWNAAMWTRQWFSWGNGLFGQMILDLDHRLPQVLQMSFQG